MLYHSPRATITPLSCYLLMSHISYLITLLSKIFRNFDGSNEYYLMLTYTNHLKKLVLPEYGRNIQNMVDRCVELPDRDERNRAAQTIVDTMLTLFPATGDRDEYVRKLWDHMLIMSDFKLDVDLPYEPVDPAVFADRPDPLPMPAMPDGRFRQYGALIRQAVAIACSMPPGEERDSLVMLTANQMKKMLVESTGDTVDDERVFTDLRMLSKGEIYLKPSEAVLYEFNPAPRSTSKKKKKK